VSFSDRTGVGRRLPARVEREVAPEPVRAALIDLLWDRQDATEGEWQAYPELCRMLHRVPDSDIWGGEVEREVNRLVMGMEWFEVYDAIEDVLEGSNSRRVDEALAQAGVAYELVDGKFWPYEPVAHELDVADIAYDALATVDPTGKLKPALAQYRKAVSFLDGRPPDLEKAVSEAANAVEAVVRVISGEKSISAGLKKLMPSGERKPLLDTMNQLFNYASAVPGARHGAHAASGLTDVEARYVVRVAGAAIAFLASADAEGALPLP
jgi:hypothetical protein